MITDAQTRRDAWGPLHYRFARQLLPGRGQTYESDRRHKASEIRLHLRMGGKSGLICMHQFWFRPYASQDLVPKNNCNIHTA